MPGLRLSPTVARLSAAAAGFVLPAAAWAQTAAAAAPPVPVPDKGDTTWMLISSVLVLLMIVPGTASTLLGLVLIAPMLLRHLAGWRAGRGRVPSVS